MKGSGSGGTTRSEQARLRDLMELAERIREDRAAGRKRWPGGAAAWVWYERTFNAWCSPKAMPLELESGAPSRGSDSPARRQAAAVACAIKAAEEDDRERHPAKPAPITRWGREHFGAGRAFAWMESAEWSEREIERRMRRALRVVSEHLRERGWLE